MEFYGDGMKNNLQIAALPANFYIIVITDAFLTNKEFNIIKLKYTHFEVPRSLDFSGGYIIVQPDKMHYD